MADTLIQKIYSSIQQRISQPISVSWLAETCDLSIYQLNRRCRYYFGMTPMALVWSLRIEFAKQLILENPHEDLPMVAQRAGFRQHSHFTKHFKRKLSVTPSQFRRDLRRSQSQSFSTSINSDR